MDIGNIKEALEKLKGDEGLKDEFKKNPVETLKDKLGVELSKEQLSSVADTIKSKLDSDGDGTIDILETIKNNAGGLFDKIEDSGAIDKIKGLFNK